MGYGMLTSPTGTNAGAGLWTGLILISGLLNRASTTPMSPMMQSFVAGVIAGVGESYWMSQGNGPEPDTLKLWTPIKIGLYSAVGGALTGMIAQNATNPNMINALGSGLGVIILGGVSPL